MKFVSFKFNGRTKIGVVEGYRVFDVQAAYALFLKEIEGDQQADKIAEVIIPDDMLSFLRAGERSLQAARQGMKFVSGKDSSAVGVNEEWISYSLNDVRIVQPLNPETILCAGPNPEDPNDPLLVRHSEFFLKSSHTVIGGEQPILIDPTISDKFDVQVELGVVIGKTGRFIPEDQVMDHIFGFTVFHNVVNRERMQVGWEGWMWHNRYGDGASFDNSAPIGPWIVEKDDIQDPENLVIRKYINEQFVETHNTKDLIRSVKQFVAYCSNFFTLEPGILISVGTPGGWVLGRDEKGNPRLKPGRNRDRFLKVGDVVKGEIVGIGTLQNPVQQRR